MQCFLDHKILLITERAKLTFLPNLNVNDIMFLVAWTTLEKAYECLLILYWDEYYNY